MARESRACALVVAVACLPLGNLACGGDLTAAPPAPCVAALPAGVSPFEPAVEWSRPLLAPGLEGSTALCDLDGDGRLEMITGIATEVQPRIYTRVSDALTGVEKWTSAPGDGGFAYPYCVDVNDDGVLDVLVAGRLGAVLALSGVDGHKLWSLGGGAGPAIRGNVYSVVADDPGSRLLFTTSGGNVLGPEITPDQRNPGALYAFDRTGTVVARWAEPAQREVFSSAAIVARRDGTRRIAFGSGGETLPGQLFILDFDEARAEFSLVSQIPSGCPEGGIVPSPTMGDLDGDGEPEVVASDYCGVTVAARLDGTVLWRDQATILFSSANPLFVDLDRDGVFDVVAAFTTLNMSKPATFAQVHSEIVAIHGATGRRLWSHEFAGGAFSSPLAVDLDGDGAEEVIEIATTPLGAADVIVLDGKTGDVLSRFPIGMTNGTPALADVDGDGRVDLLFATQKPEMLPAGAPSYVGDSAVRIEFPAACGGAAKAFGGFRGYPIHDGLRP